MLPRTPPSPPPPPPPATAQKLGRVENSTAAVKIDAAPGLGLAEGGVPEELVNWWPTRIGLGLCAGVGAVYISQTLKVFWVRDNFSFETRKSIETQKKGLRVWPRGGIWCVRKRRGVPPPPQQQYFATQWSSTLQCPAEQQQRFAGCCFSASNPPPPPPSEAAAGSGAARPH